MRRVTAILSVAAVTLMAAGLVAQAKPSFVPQAKPSFAGEWKIVAEQGLGQPGVDLTITESATAMTLEYRGGTKLTYTLDGSVSKNVMPDKGGGALTAQVSKAVWAGSKLVVTTTTGAGEEKRTFTTDGAFLVVETLAPAKNGGALTKVTYQRYQRGFGG
jgi:hypothetical protein